MRTWALTMLGLESEIPLLEIRLAELDKVVDVHVVAEATTTFAGDRKPLWYRRHRMRFKQWAPKVRYVVVSDMPAGRQVTREPALPTTACDSDRWRRENHQREALGRGLQGLAPDDVLLLSDLDEIPRADAFAEGIDMAHHGLIARPRLAMHVYRMTWRWPQPLPVIARFFTVPTLDAHGWSVQQVRLAEGDPYGAQRDPAGLGWHLAYTGGVDAIQAKLAAAAHHELDTPQYNAVEHVQHCIDTGADLFDRAQRQAHRVSIDELPAHVQRNPERFEHLL